MDDTSKTKGKAATRAKGKAKAAPKAKAATRAKAPATETKAAEIQAMAVADARANPTRVVRSSRTEEGGDEGRGPVIERGDIFFFYRPDVDDEAPGNLLDVRRFHIVLRPEGGDVVRLITVGRKMLPGSGEDGGNFWAFVDRVFSKPEDLRTYLGEATYQLSLIHI